MANYVLSDIHGDIDRWNKMKSLIEFTSEDRMWIIGDVIDRGEHGISILQEIMNMPNVTLILGNHECMMIDNWNIKENDPDIEEVRDNWMYNGGWPTVQAMMKLPEEEQEKIIRYVKNCPPIAKLKTVDGRKYIIAHGWFTESTTKLFDIVWGRPDKQSNPELNDETQLIIGHTPVEYFCNNIDEMRAMKKSHAKILHAPHFIDIDCGCGHDRSWSRLSCLRLNDMKEFYV